MSTFKFQLSELTEGLDVSIKGDPNCIITGICTLTESKPQHLSFLINSVYRKHLLNTRAAAVILAPSDAEHCAVNAIISNNPHYTFARIARFFETKVQASGIVHPSVIVGKNCLIDSSVNIAANCVIGDNVRLARDVVLGAGCIIGENVVIDCETRLDAHVTVYRDTKIGERCHLASGVVLGSDGFGFANEKGTWHRVPQLGAVIIGNDVSIGANTCIDRGAVGDTVIEDGVKLDNLIQIAHNVRVGAHTVIAACVGISGSTSIGKNCMIGGASNFAGHISICDHVMITGMSAVTKSITEPGMYSSGIVGVVPSHEFRKNNARFHRLGQLMERVKTIEHNLKKRA